MERLTELLGYWNNSLPEKVDYADLVCAPAFARGYRMVYEDEYGYMVEETIKALEEMQQYRRAEENGLLLRLPCKVGDVVYIIGKCFAIPNQLDGTLYDPEGGLGTATGYYCPYEEKCPHDNEDFTGCDVYIHKKAVFEDIAKSIWIDEDGMHVCGEETTICADIGDTVFLTREEAEAKLAEMVGSHDGK